MLLWRELGTEGTSWLDVKDLPVMYPGSLKGHDSFPFYKNEENIFICPHWHGVPQLVFQTWIPGLSWKFETLSVIDMKRALKKESGEASCCVSLGNPFQLSGPQFLYLERRKHGDGLNQTFHLQPFYSTGLSLPWQNHLLFYLLFSKSTSFKEETSCCCGTHVPWWEGGCSGSVKPGPLFSHSVLWGLPVSLKETVTWAYTFNVLPIP